jgi:hypothetical protein
VGLDHREGYACDGVPDCDAVVSVGARVEDDPVGCVPGTMDGGDELAFRIGLKVAHLNAAFRRERAKLADDVSEGLAPVNLGLSKSQQIEIGSVEKKDPGHWAAITDLASIPSKKLSAASRTSLA